jgi:hypothetical protein
MTVPKPREESTPMENGQKLDNIQDTVTEIRVSVATLSGDVRASLARHDRQDVVSADVERRLRALEAATAVVPVDVESRLRTLERRIYGIPSLAAVLALASLGLAVWLGLHK